MSLQQSNNNHIGRTFSSLRNPSWPPKLRFRN